MEAAELFKLHEIELLWHRFWQPLDNSNSTIGISKYEDYQVIIILKIIEFMRPLVPK